MQTIKSIMFRLAITRILGLAMLGATQAAEKPDSAGGRKPNIIFILADDLGVGNVSCYGADNFKTPHIDTLAKGGMRFEHCYAAPLCGPSRALLMTGRYAYHTGMTGNGTGPLLKPANEVMMPKVLKTAGYVTAMSGKWSQMPLQPADWGFDEYLRFDGSGQYWNTQPGNKTYTVNGREVPLLDGEYLPDKMQNFVVDFITRHKDEPFYVYYSLSQVHSDIHKKMLPTPDSAPDSKDFFNDNIVYMDKLVGKLIAELDRLELRRNTLVVFAGDNGTASEDYPRSTIHGKILAGHKGSMQECGALVPCIANWPGAIKPGQDEKHMVNICDFFPTLAQVAGAEPPRGVTIDGQGFAPALLGKSHAWPRNWIFVELGRHWYDRDKDWKLNEANDLFDMRDAPFTEHAVPITTRDGAAIAARKRLQAILDELNPVGGILDPGDGSGSGPLPANIKDIRDIKKQGGKDNGNGIINSGNTNAGDQ